jgi:cytochrome c556
MRFMLKAAFTAALVASLQLVHAQQPPPAPPPKPYVPLAADALANNSEHYVGENVTVTAAVGRVLSRSAFAVEQRPVVAKQDSKDVLVLAPILNGPVEPNKYVTVAGEVVRFDPAEIAKKVKGYQVDLPPDAIEKYRGRPAIVAKVVVNDKSVDLAMRMPPPETAEEKALDAQMKKIAPAFAALRGGVDASKSDVASQQIAVLKQAFTQTESIWKTKGIAEATKLAQDARKHVDAIEQSAIGGDWEAAKKSVASLNQACQTCHTSYRERFDDGSYRIKKPGL